MDRKTIKEIAEIVVGAHKVREASYFKRPGQTIGQYGVTYYEVVQAATVDVDAAARPLIAFLVVSGEGVDVCRNILDALKDE